MQWNLKLETVIGQKKIDMRHFQEQGRGWGGTGGEGRWLTSKPHSGFFSDDTQGISKPWFMKQKDSEFFFRFSNFYRAMIIS